MSFRHSGARAQHANPESITRSAAEYGFGARASGASRNDEKKIDFETLITGADATPLTADTLSDEVAFWLYTSGSTGDPKGVKHVHSSLMATAKLFGRGILGITENDVVHSASKLFFAYGLGNAMTFPLSVGATAVLWPHRPSPEGVFDIMRTHRPTIFYGCLLYTSPSPRDSTSSRMPSSA